MKDLSYIQSKREG